MLRFSRVPAPLALLLALVLAAALLWLAAGRAADPAVAGDARPVLELEPVLDTALAAAGAGARPCHDGWRPGAAGVATAEAAAPGAGLLQVRLAGGRGDWDVAVFDAAGDVVAAGASADAQEVASGWLDAAGPLRVQACRRGEDATGSVGVLVEHAELPAETAELRADPPQLVDVLTPTREAKERLLRLGLDMTEHGGTDSLGVVLHGEADRDALRRAGLRWEVLVDDLVERDVLDRRAEQRYAARTARSALPSGRDTYRELFDYYAEMKALAEQNPGLVKLITLPERSYEGREVLGLEITTDVERNLGKPAFANLGVHHAREWPSGEHTMEWAYELVNGYKAGDPRTVRIVERTRNLVVPIVNPDGFETSRTTSGAPDGGQDESIPDTAYILLRPYEYRRKNCRLPVGDGGSCLPPSLGVAENGVDVNRNYGALWGGPGADTNPLTGTYRGPAPFSEPEARNIRALVSRHQVTTLITNHTTGGLVLRAPGLEELGDPVDEDRGYKALGDAMAAHNGYFSQKGFELYDTTGTTEDWSYNVTGGFGFTFEIYCGAPNYQTGDCDDPAFHPRFQRVVEEWDGTSPQADHAGDPGPLAGFDGQGNREAYYIAAESTLDESRHSVLEGTAPPGATLRLRKAFETQTFPQPDPDGGEPAPIEFEDVLETTYDVGGDGAFRWHVNPSTRPIVAQARGRAPEGPPSPTRDDLDGTAGTDARPCPNYYPLLDALPSPERTDPTCWNDHAFEIPVGEGVDNETTIVRFTFAETDDWDLEVFEDVDGNGVSGGDDVLVASSGNGATNQVLGLEEVTLSKPDTTTRYVARMINYAATGGYEGSVVYAGPTQQEAQVEAWTLTCEVDGQVLQTVEVVIDRGEAKAVGLGACRRAAGVEDGKGEGGGPAACPSTAGLRSASVRPRGRGAVLRFAGGDGARPVAVSVLKAASGRRVVGRKLVARFRGRTKAVRWNGRATRPGRRVTNGFYVARFRGAGGTVREVALRRKRGRFSVRPAMQRADGCGVLREARLNRPVFGGRTGKALRLSYKLAGSARVTVKVKRRGEVLRRFKLGTRAADEVHRLRIPPKGLPRGDHRVRIVAGTVRATLTARRL